MIKNTTRKGLALLSTAALSFAGLVGFAAPAQANSLVTLAPKVGTEYAVPLDAAFTLETRSAASDNPYGDNMYLEVADADGQLLSALSVELLQPTMQPTRSGRLTLLRLLVPRMTSF